MTSTPSAGAGVLEVESSAANAAAPPPERGPGLEEAWTRDFVRRIACAKFLAAVEPWMAAARRAVRSPEGGRDGGGTRGHRGGEAVAAAAAVVAVRSKRPAAE
jgi:hypothetical protein